MRSIAQVRNSYNNHHADVSSGKHNLTITVPPKAAGYGSDASGGELLMLALATCYCNDLYREARKLGFELSGVEVECSAEFQAEGAPASEITYAAKIAGSASEDQLRELATLTDRVAEIHNTVRASIPVSLARVDVEPHAASASESRPKA